MSTPAADTQAIVDAVIKLGAERDALKAQGGGGVTPPATGAALLLSEDFAGNAITSPYLSAWSSTPNAYTGTIKAFEAYAGKSAGHYYAQKGTNEQTPWQVMIDRDSAQTVFGKESFDEFCFEWQEHFVTPYPWATAGQKMFRVGYENDAVAASRKSAELACLDSGTNMQFAAYWGGTSGANSEWFKNTGIAHPTNRWVKWRVWMKLNTSGKADGFIRVFQDDKPFIAGESLKLRDDTDPRGFNWCWIGGNYSQRGGVGTLASNGHRYITALRLWNTSPA